MYTHLIIIGIYIGTKLLFGRVRRIEYEVKGVGRS